MGYSFEASKKDPVVVVQEVLIRVVLNGLFVCVIILKHVVLNRLFVCVIILKHTLQGGVCVCVCVESVITNHV